MIASRSSSELFGNIETSLATKLSSTRRIPLAVTKASTPVMRHSDATKRSLPLVSETKASNTVEFLESSVHQWAVGSGFTSIDSIGAL